MLAPVPYMDLCSVSTFSKLLCERAANTCGRCAHVRERQRALRVASPWRRATDRRLWLARAQWPEETLQCAPLLRIRPLDWQHEQWPSKSARRGDDPAFVLLAPPCETRPCGVGDGASTAIEAAIPCAQCLIVPTGSPVAKRKEAANVACQ